MGMPRRQYSSTNGYRYGFNGKENDNEVKGDGNQQDYGMRIYDSRLGKFLSVDPISKDYPGIGPYVYAENDVVRSIDLDGLEKYIVIGGGPFGASPTIVCFGCGIRNAYDNYSSGMTQKSEVENKNMSYHNDNVPQSIQNRLDKKNTTDANGKIANGLAQTAKINVQTSFDIASSFAPISEGFGLVGKGASRIFRSSVANKFYKAAGYVDKAKRASHISAINLNLPVEKVTLEKGTIIEQWVRPGGEIRDYFAPQNADPSKLGIFTGNRTLKKFTLEENVEVLRSTTKDIKKTDALQHSGGEIQYFSPELKKKIKEIISNVQQKKVG
jgi:RHS repeat-associated protein